MGKASLIIILLFFSINHTIYGQSTTEKPTGNWICHTEYGSVSLKFISETQLEYDNERLDYSITGSNIIVPSDYGYSVYPFQLSDSNLTITFPEGYQLLFIKADNDNTRPLTVNTPDQGQEGSHGYLMGKLCEYGSSSSYSTYSSYSHTNWVYFDGKGNFRYGSESSYSGNEGIAYGKDDSPGNTGTYKITPDKVYLTFNDGNSVTLVINMKQNDGRITELLYGKKLYASGLCD